VKLLEECVGTKPEVKHYITFLWAGAKSVPAQRIQLVPTVDAHELRGTPFSQQSFG
jgi:hypothetical protein